MVYYTIFADIVFYNVSIYTYSLELLLGTHIAKNREGCVRSAQE